MTSKDMTNATFSPASADGPMPSTSRDGPLTDQCGPEAVPVSRFRALDSTKAMPTNDTSGPLFSALSPSAALSASLARRLQARMDVNGSPEYELTWKHWDMPAGPLVYQLRASPRRTSAADCIGWPTPRAADGHKNTRTYQGAKNEAERVGLRRSDLQTVVQVMMGRPAPPGRLADSRRGGAQHQRRDMAGASGQVAPEIQQRQRVRDDFGDGRPNRRLGDYRRRKQWKDVGERSSNDSGRGPLSGRRHVNTWRTASRVEPNSEWVWCGDGYYRRIEPLNFPAG